METVRTLPRSVVVAAAAGLTAVVLVGSLMLAFRSGDDEPGLSAGQQPAGEPTPAPDDAPALEVQQYADRGISVNLPAHWEQTETTEIRVDFGDPASPSTRRLRLLFEASGADARRFVENVAENGIRNNCPEPYERVDLHDFELAGLPATQLEYTCGTGQDARHALWATVVRDGVAVLVLRDPAAGPVRGVPRDLRRACAAPFVEFTGGSSRSPTGGPRPRVATWAYGSARGDGWPTTRTRPPGPSCRTCSTGGRRPRQSSPTGSPGR